MKKKFIFLLLFMFLFIPMLHAEGNFYELKLYELFNLDSLGSDEYEALSLIDSNFVGNENYAEVYIRGKKVGRVTYNPDTDSTSYEVEPSLTANDNFVYLFSDRDRERFTYIDTQLNNYDGIDVIVTPIQECNQVCIKRVSLYSKSAKSEIINDATFNGLNVNFDVSVKNVNDYVKYKMILSNPTDKDYEISESNNNSEYITYEYSYEDNDKTLKSKSDKVVYVTIRYKNEVPQELFNDNYFEDVKDISLSLGNGLENPKTLDASTFVLIALGVLLLGSIVLYKYTNRKEFIGTLVISMILIPISIMALEKIDINIKSKVQIANKFYKGTIYRNNRCNLNLGENYESLYKWEYHGSLYDTKSECEESLPNSYSTCIIKCLGAGEYTYSPDQFIQNNRVYIKNEIVNNISTKNQVCFRTNKEICLTQGDYENNKILVLGEQSWFESNNGSCEEIEGGYMCEGDDLLVIIGSEGTAQVNNYNDNCSTIGCDFK